MDILCSYIYFPTSRLTKAYRDTNTEKVKCWAEGRQCHSSDYMSALVTSGSNTEMMKIRNAMFKSVELVHLTLIQNTCFNYVGRACPPKFEQTHWVRGSLQKNQISPFFLPPAAYQSITFGKQLKLTAVYYYILRSPADLWGYLQESY